MSGDYRSSQAISKFYTNSFTCINIAKTSSNSSSWPLRGIFPAYEYQSGVQSTVHVPTVRSNFRESIMNHAKQLQSSQQTPKIVADARALSKKRKSSDVAAQESEQPLKKQLRTAKPNTADTPKHLGDTRAPSRAVEAPSTTTLSAKTMSKLNAFRFCGARSNDYLDELAKEGMEDAFKLRDHQRDETLTTESKYALEDHSTRLIQSGKEEMARLQQADPIDPYEETNSERENADDDVIKSQSRYKMKDYSSRLIQARINGPPKAQVSGARSSSEAEVGIATAPFTQYKMKDHASRLIKAGTKELPISAKKVSPVFSENHDDSNVTHICPTELNDVIVNLDDLDDSMFDDPCLDGSAFEEGTPTNTNIVTEMDDMDDFIFEQIIAEDEVDCQEAPSSAQPEINCLSSDAANPSIKRGLMLPPKLPFPVSLPKTVSNANNPGDAAIPKTPISPFIRPQRAVLVTSPSSMPNLDAPGRVATCFRLAELFREISSPSPPSAIELFATVKASVRNRDSTSQSFMFADLFFPQRPPYVHGAYSRYAESELFDDDSRPFLKAGQGGKGILARTITRPKPKSGKQLLRNQENGFHASVETSGGMELEVLSIYVCAWEDVEYTKGIVMPEKEVPTNNEGEQEAFYKPEKKRKFSPLKSPEQNPALKDISSNLPSSPKRMSKRKK